MTTINIQEENKRLIVHVLHYIPERRGEQFDTIEDVIPLHNVGISVRMDNRYVYFFASHKRSILGVETTKNCNISKCQHRKIKKL